MVKTLACHARDNGFDPRTDRQIRRCSVTVSTTASNSVSQGSNPCTLAKIGVIAKRLKRIWGCVAERLRQGLQNLFMWVRVPSSPPQWSYRMFTVEEVLKWEGISVIDALVLTDLCKSKSDARRMIEQGAIRVDDIKVTNTKAVLLFSPDRTKHCVVH